jgi:predicted transcriptional regulator
VDAKKRTIEVSNYPQRRGELVQAASSDGWTVYVSETDSLHVLNDSARAIWELCDGKTSPSEMAHAISELTGLDAGHAIGEVTETLQSLERVGLVSVERSETDGDR